MSSYTINVLSDADDSFVLELLQALQNKHIIDVQPKRRSIGLPSKPLTDEEFFQEIELARKSTIRYTAEEAKKILNL